MENGVELNCSASSVEFTSTGCEKIYLNGKNTGSDIYFAVYINGIRQEERVKFTPYSTSALIAQDLIPKNTYKVKLVRETRQNSGKFIAEALVLGDLSNAGTLCAPPAQSNLYIEFAGASIPEYATDSYAFIAAQTLEADFRIAPDSGNTVENMTEYYNSVSNGRTPDLVVVDFGDEDINGLISAIKKAYDGVKIICAGSGSNNGNVYYCDLSGDRKAEKLVSFITENEILAEKESALSSLTLTDYGGNSIDLSGYSLVWYDGFTEASLDSEKWAQDNSLRTETIASTKGENNLTVGGDTEDAEGTAVLASKRVDATHYTVAGGLCTENLMAFKYGYVEFRAKIPYDRPAWSALWMKSNRTIENSSTPYMTEIDIMECFGRNNGFRPNVHMWPDTGGSIQVNNLVEDYVLGEYSSNYEFENTENLKNEWHTYGLLLEKDSAKFFVDGVCFSVLDSSADKFWKYGNNQIGLNDYYHLIIGNGLITPERANWEGVDTSKYVNENDEFPISLTLDYVRLYQNSNGKIHYGKLP